MYAADIVSKGSCVYKLGVVLIKAGARHDAEEPRRYALKLDERTISWLELK